MSTSHLKSNPYLFFFPLAAFFAFLGVGQWMLDIDSSVWPSSARVIFHAMTQVQGFVCAFVSGFLFTAVPKRTQSATASWLQLIGAVVGIGGTVLMAGLQQWAYSQLFFWVWSISLLSFLLPRLYGKAGSRKPPYSFIWLPLGVLYGVIGGVLTGIGGYSPEHLWWLHDLGQNLTLQAMPLSYIIGAGGLVFFVMPHGKPTADAGSGRAKLRGYGFHVVVFVLISLSFLFQPQMSTALAYGVRGVLVVSVFLFAYELWRLPERSGVVRWLVWIGAWLVPLGYIFSGVFPALQQAGIHITFIGGFALLCFAVAAQVTLGHGGHEDLKNGRPLPLIAFALLLGAALVSRTMMVVWPEHYFMNLHLSAQIFASALGVWSIFIFSKLRRRS